MRGYPFMRVWLIPKVIDTAYRAAIGIVRADITRYYTSPILDIIVVVCVAIEGIRNIRQPTQTFAQIFISF